MTTVPWEQQSTLQRMATVVERVQDRLKRSTAALDAAGVLYAVCGGNAVAAWVTTADPSAVRNTQDVDILLRREDLDAAEQALAAGGFVRRHTAGIERFLDGPDSRPRDAVHVVIAREKIRTDYDSPAPDVVDVERLTDFRVVALENLVRMKLTSFRRKDQVHLSDMLDVGLIDAAWVARYPPALGERLQMLIDTPEG